MSHANGEPRSYISMWEWKIIWEGQMKVLRGKGMSHIYNIWLFYAPVHNQTGQSMSSTLKHPIKVGGALPLSYSWGGMCPCCSNASHACAPRLRLQFKNSFDILPILPLNFTWRVQKVHNFDDFWRLHICVAVNLNCSNPSKAKTNHWCADYCTRWFTFVHSALRTISGRNLLFL